MRRRIVKGELVEIFGRDAGLHFRDHQVQNFGSQAAGAAHTLEILRLMEGDRKMRPAGRFEHFGVGHYGHARLLM